MQTKHKIALGALLVVSVGIISGAVQNSNTVTYTAPVMETVATSTPVLERDVVEEAKQELERINAELDAEESKLLEEKAEIETRLEEIRDTRTSFQ